MSDSVAVPMAYRIADIKVGERRREDYGDIDALAQSIRVYGLLHPVVIDDDGNLVAGERRLRACRQLGWTEIETTNVGLLTEESRREIELEENLRRKDLTSYEEAKFRVLLADAAAAVLRDSADIPSKLDEKPRTGRPQKADSREKVAERIGIPQSELSRATAHVETAEAHPVFQQPDWKQSQVLAVREQLERIPEPERETAVKATVKPGIPPQSTVKMLGTLATKPEPERQRIYAMDASPDPRDNNDALTTLFETPPMPDPRLTMLERVLFDLKPVISGFPNDPETPRLIEIRAELRAMVKAIEAKGAHRVEAVS